MYCRNHNTHYKPAMPCLNTAFYLLFFVSFFQWLRLTFCRKSVKITTGFLLWQTFPGIVPYALGKAYTVLFLLLLHRITGCAVSCLFSCVQDFLCKFFRIVFYRKNCFDNLNNDFSPKRCPVFFQRFYYCFRTLFD